MKGIIGRHLGILIRGVKNQHESELIKQKVAKETEGKEEIRVKKGKDVDILPGQVARISVFVSAYRNESANLNVFPTTNLSARDIYHGGTTVAIIERNGKTVLTNRESVPINIAINIADGGARLITLHEERSNSMVALKNMVSGHWYDFEAIPDASYECRIGDNKNENTEIEFYIYSNQKFTLKGGYGLDIQTNSEIDGDYVSMDDNF